MYQSCIYTFYLHLAAQFKLYFHVQAACDFVAALRLDPNNKELIALFEKAKEKYQQVEGKEITIEDISMKLSRNG